MTLPPDQLDAIARTVHEALRAWAAAHGQYDIPPWYEAEPWMHDSTRDSVRHALESDAPSGRSQHENWLDKKRQAGWQYGPVKDAEAKTHPLMVPYDDLPDWERRKDALIIALARALA
ncbi:MAG: RyR domain-containing protein [Hyphomonas sp.]